MIRINIAICCTYSAHVFAGPMQPELLHPLLISTDDVLFLELVGVVLIVIAALYNHA